MMSSAWSTCTSSRILLRLFSSCLWSCRSTSKQLSADVILFASMLKNLSCAFTAWKSCCSRIKPAKQSQTKSSQSVSLYDCVIRVISVLYRFKPAKRSQTNSSQSVSLYDWVYRVKSVLYRFKPAKRSYRRKKKTSQSVSKYDCVYRVIFGLYRFKPAKRSQTKSAQSVSLDDCVYQLITGLFSWSKQVLWCFTPSQPVRIYQGEPAAERDNNNNAKNTKQQVCIHWSV